MELSHEKTQITHIEDGFDFLGQNVRRYPGGKVLTKPSKQSVKTFLTKIQKTIDRSGSQTAGEMIRRLNQQIKGWTMYHRYAASKRTFKDVDHRIFQNGVALVPATAGGMFSLGGDAKTAGDWPLQLQGQYVSFRLDPWARLFLNNRLGGQVTASGSFKANGSLRDASKFHPRRPHHRCLRKP